MSQQIADGHPRKLKSLVWSHLEYKDGGGGGPRAECKYCGKILTARHVDGTSHLWRHITSAKCMEIQQGKAAGAVDEGNEFVEYINQIYDDLVAKGLHSIQ
uniref:BED-type domain-containing protein n=1 Tax=Oryza brachyantha TaxID=4533 RepID=J3MB92_ORYBR